jgi:uncharacterized protein with WD repeat
METPRQYSLVKFDFSTLPDEYANQYPFKPNKRYIFFGEMPNMEGHCIVMDYEGKHFIGYHTENFIEMNEDELDTFDL